MSNRIRYTCILITIICIILVIVEMCQAQTLQPWEQKILDDWSASQQIVNRQDPNRFYNSYVGGTYVPDPPAEPQVIIIRREYTVWDPQYYWTYPGDYRYNHNRRCR